MSFSKYLIIKDNSQKTKYETSDKPVKFSLQAKTNEPNRNLNWTNQNFPMYKFL